MGKEKQPPRNIEGQSGDRTENLSYGHVPDESNDQRDNNTNKPPPVVDQTTTTMPRRNPKED